MRHLSLVKSLSQVKEEQKFSQDFVEVSPLRLLRGSLSELAGKASTGKTALTLALLAELTRSGEVCAVVDVSNSFDPESAALSGVMLENILWIRCNGDIEKAFSVTDLLVQAKGFGAIWLNLNSIPLRQLRFIPGSFWYRFRVGVSGSPTLLLATAKESISGSAAGQSYSLKKVKAQWKGSGRFKLLSELQVDIRSSRPVSYSSVVSRIGSFYEDI